MHPETLRKKHPLIRYRSFSCTQVGELLFIEFDFKLEPSTTFHPKLCLPIRDHVKPGSLHPFIFNLGMVELISYFKAACPRRVVVEAGMLTGEQLAWWKDLFTHGLGEFFYTNEIDFTDPDFFNIETVQSPFLNSPPDIPTAPGQLVLVGGGKDSAVTAELLKDFPSPKSAFMLNPTRAALESAAIAGYTEPIVAKRSIDPQLLRLNNSGYLNGHTPFSAYLAFLAALAAAANGYSELIVSNERSSSEENVIYKDFPINHQYSKSYRFEARYNDYLQKWLAPSQRYLSFIRPLYDIQVSRIFSSFTKQIMSFRSCNVLQRQDLWCLNCPKCAFVYLTLFPFAAPHLLDFVFGSSLFVRPEAQKQIRSLCGYENVKPFECVGTIHESRAAVLLSLDRHEKLSLKAPDFLVSLARKIEDDGMTLASARSLLESWTDEHGLEPDYEQILREALGWPESF